MSIPKMFFREETRLQAAEREPSGNTGRWGLNYEPDGLWNRETTSPEALYFPGAQSEAACSSDSSHLQAPRVNSALTAPTRPVALKSSSARTDAAPISERRSCHLPCRFHKQQILHRRPWSRWLISAGTECPQKKMWATGARAFRFPFGGGSHGFKHLYECQHPGLSLSLCILRGFNRFVCAETRCSSSVAKWVAALSACTTLRLKHFDQAA